MGMHPAPPLRPSAFTPGALATSGRVGVAGRRARGVIRFGLSGWGRGLGFRV